MSGAIGPGSEGMNLEHIKTCVRCGLRYDWRRSSSDSLKMTYCSHLCEAGDLGFTLEALLHAQPPTSTEAEAAPSEPETAAI